MQGSAVKHGSGSVLDRQRQITVYTLSIIHAALTPPSPMLSSSLSLHNMAMLTGSAGVSGHLLIQVSSLSARERERWRDRGRRTKGWQREKERNKSVMNNGEVVVLLHLLKTHPNSGHRSHINSQKPVGCKQSFQYADNMYLSFHLYRNWEKNSHVCA